MKCREDEFKALIAMIIGFIMVIIVPFVVCLNIATEYSEGVGFSLFFLGGLLFLTGACGVIGTN